MARYSEQGETPSCSDTDSLRVVYAEYAKTSDLFAVAVYLIALLAAQTANIGRF